MLPKLTVLLCTIGRESLRQMLHSLAGELRAEDNLVVVADGDESRVGAERICGDILKDFKSQVKLIVNPIKMGFWGHPIRNMSQHGLPGDFILHADDDDVYMPGAFDLIRRICVSKETLYIFQMTLPCGTVVWSRTDRFGSNVGTPMGVIPNVPSKFPQWKNYYGGDGEFYEQAVANFGTVQWIKEIIYTCRPQRCIL